MVGSSACTEAVLHNGCCLVAFSAASSISYSPALLTVLWQTQFVQLMHSDKWMRAQTHTDTNTHTLSNTRSCHLLFFDPGLLLFILGLLDRLSDCKLNLRQHIRHMSHCLPVCVCVCMPVCVCPLSLLQPQKGVTATNPLLK